MKTTRERGPSFQPNPAAIAALLALGSGGSWAQSESSVQEVVVTATKQEKALSKSVGSISAVTGAALEARSVSTTAEVFSNIPNITFETFTVAGPSINIRGVANNNNGVFEPAVSMYVDEIYVPRPVSFTGILSDIERVEVLRGPQGTVFGKNTVGGLMHVVTNKPGRQQEMSADVTLGSLGLKQVRATVNQPLDQAGNAIRVNVAYKGVDGWLENRTPGSQPLYGEHFAGGRVSLALKPGKDVEVLLGAEYGELRGTGDQHTDVDGNPTDRVTTVGTAGGFWRHETAFTGRVTFKLGGLDATSLSSWREGRSTAKFDQDFGAAPGVLTTFPERNRLFTQEVRLASNGSGSLNWLAGAFYMKQGTLNSLGVAFGNDTGPAAALVDTDVTLDSRAIFGSAELKLSPQLTLAGGARYTSEQKHYDFSTTLVSAPFPPGTLSRPVSIDETAWSSDVSLSWLATPDTLLYAKLAHGFKGGGFDSVSAFNGGAITTIGSKGAVPFDAGQFIYKPEKLDNIEVGFKYQRRDFRLFGSLFHMKYKDKQEQITRPTTLGGIPVTISTTANAATVTASGIELETSALINKAWRVDASLGYLDATYDSFIDPSGRVNLSGKRLQRAPKWTGSVANTIYFSAPGGTLGSARFEVNHRDRSFLASDNNSFAVQKAHTIVNLRGGVDTADGKFGLYVFGKNVTDETVFVAASNSNKGGMVNAPRTWGIELRANW